MYRMLHRFAAALGVTFDPSGMDIPAEKLRRGYAHQHSLHELIARFDHRPDQGDIMRRAMEGLDWTLRRLALYARANARVLLRNPREHVRQMTVLIDAKPALDQEHKVVFGLPGIDPVTFGGLRHDDIHFDPSQPLPVTHPITSDALGAWLTRGEEGQRPIDAIMGVVASHHDADAHCYWKAGPLASAGGSHWAETGERPAQGQWF